MKKKDIKFSIAIDGSSASGKTTGSKIISKEFKFKVGNYIAIIDLTKLPLSKFSFED